MADNFSGEKMILKAEQIKNEREKIFRKRQEIQEILNGSKQRIADPLRLPPKIGRNEKCPCGSGKKFKKCCGEKEQEYAKH